MKLFNRKKRRIRKKRDRQRIRAAIVHTLIISVAVSSAIAGAFGYKYIQSMEIFKIKHINVYGQCRFNKETIIKLSGIETERSIYSADLTKGSRKLESDPWIDRAMIKRKFPDTVEIRIEEHEPLAMIKLDSYYLIDKKGFVFKKASRKELSYPRITGLHKKDILHSKSTVRLIDAALELIRIMKHRKLFRNDLEIVADKTFGISISNYLGNIKTNLGFDQLDEKIIILKEISRDLKSRGLAAKRINIKSPEKAYVTI